MLQLTGVLWALPGVRIVYLHWRANENAKSAHGKRTFETKDSGTIVPSMSSTTAVGSLGPPSLRLLAGGALGTEPLAAPQQQECDSCCTSLEQ